MNVFHLLMLSFIVFCSIMQPYLSAGLDAEWEQQELERARRSQALLNAQEHPPLNPDALTPLPSHGSTSPISQIERRGPSVDERAVSPQLQHGDEQTVATDDVDQLRLSPSRTRDAHPRSNPGPVPGSVDWWSDALLSYEVRELDGVMVLVRLLEAEELPQHDAKAVHIDHLAI